VGCLDGCMDGWRDGWLEGWDVGRLVGAAEGGGGVPYTIYDIPAAARGLVGFALKAPTRRSHAPSPFMSPAMLTL